MSDREQTKNCRTFVLYKNYCTVSVFLYSCTCVVCFLLKDDQSQRMPDGVKDQNRGSIEVLVCISNLGVICRIRSALFHPVMLMN